MIDIENVTKVARKGGVEYIELTTNKMLSKLDLDELVEHECTSGPEDGCDYCTKLHELGLIPDYEPSLEELINE